MEGKADTPKFGKPEVRVSASDDYELGVEVDGHWVNFVRFPGEQVRANVANAQAQADAQEGTS